MALACGGGIIKMNADGSDLTQLLPDTGLYCAQGVAVSPDGQYLYVADTGHNEVFRVDASDGSNRTVITTDLLNPESLMVSPDGKTLVVANSGYANGPGHVTLVNADGSGQTNVGSYGSVSCPAGVAIDSNNNIFVADGCTNDIWGLASATDLPSGGPIGDLVFVGTIGLILGGLLLTTTRRRRHRPIVIPVERSR